MTRNPTTPRHRISAVALLAAGALFAAPAVRADFPLPHELHQEIRADVHRVLRTLVRIPAEIHRDHVRHLDSFFGGNSYYEPHRHHHSTYNFPVRIDDGIDYRPYVYCNGRLYGHSAPRPQFWNEWGVASHGHWCGSHRNYYPTAHSCFRPQRHSGYRSEARSYGRSYHPPYGRSHGSSHYRSESRSHGSSHYRSDGRSNRSYHRPEGRSNGHSYQRPGYRSDSRSHHGRRDRPSQHRHDRHCRHDGGRGHR